MLLIIDLDDTIFRTKSIDFTCFSSAIKILEEYTLVRFGTEKSAVILEELKEDPFDIVAARHDFPSDMSQRFYKELQTMDYDLKIEVYDDYPFLKQLTQTKFLVTTGFTKLQEAKIDSLGIASDFQEIYIDDPASEDRKGKGAIFKDIMEQTNSTPDQLWIIGDNPLSEIKAGKELGMNTIQRFHEGREHSEYSDHLITNFSELATILNLHAETH